MNIFLPYENDTRKSVGALDDKRLLKQILEVRQILKVADGESEGYKNHPITKHYIQYKNFLIVYGYDCCLEYNFRFHRHHKYSDYFKERYRNETNYGKDVFWIPFYAEGVKDSFNCIRTTENVSNLYKNKLCLKWNEDIAKGQPPKWTNRVVPIFYFNLGEDKNER